MSTSKMTYNTYSSIKPHMTDFNAARQQAQALLAEAVDHDSWGDLLASTADMAFWTLQGEDLVLMYSDPQYCPSTGEMWFPEPAATIDENGNLTMAEWVQDLLGVAA